MSDAADRGGEAAQPARPDHDLVGAALPRELRKDLCRTTVAHFGCRIDPGDRALLLGELARDVAMYVVEPCERAVDGLGQHAHRVGDDQLAARAGPAGCVLQCDARVQRPVDADEDASRQRVMHRGSGHGCHCTAGDISRSWQGGAVRCCAGSCPQALWAARGAGATGDVTPAAR
jgi:hypothetical protein